VQEKHKSDLVRYRPQSHNSPQLSSSSWEET